MTRLKFYFLCLGLICSVSLFSQQSHVRFKRITINDGLSLSSVYCIFQDSKGFMWFGTEDGLNRYDGRNFHIYRSDPQNPNSISYKWIEQIHEDRTGNLWFGSRGGLTHFNPITETFTQFRGVEPHKELANDTITHLYQSSADKLWIGTLHGINCINPLTLKIQTFQAPLDIQSRINCFLNAGKGNFWIGTNSGLFYFDSANNTFSKKEFLNHPVLEVNSLELDDELLWVGTNSGLFSHALSETSSNLSSAFLKESQIESILLDSKRNLWIVTDKALFEKDYKSNVFSKAVKSFESTNSLSINTKKPIIENRKSEIWFGTFGSGLFRLSQEKSQKIHYQSNLADSQSLSENSINCIYEDRSGVIWIGTFGAGISIYDPQSHKFDLLKHNPLNENSLPSNFIWSVFEDHKGDLWIGTNDKGVAKYNFKRDSFTHYNFEEIENHHHSAIRELFEDSKNNLWIGTDGEGLIKFDTKTGNRVNFKSIPGKNNSLSNNSVRVVYEDRDGIIWVGTRDGLNKYNPQDQSFKQFKHSERDTNSLTNNFVYSCIFEDSRGFLWIGTYGGGVSIFDKKSETFKNFRFSVNRKNGISDNVVFSVYEDKNGIIWLGTNNKLNRYDPKSETFSYFGTNEGLPNEVIYGILPDDHDNIWLSTNNGICKFSLTDHLVTNFTVHDGLQSNEFNGGAFFKGKSGMLYFGGVYGLNIINPNQQFPEEQLYDVVLTKLEILGEMVQVNSSVSPDLADKIQYNSDQDTYTLSKSISFAKKIELAYGQAFFSLEFTSLSNYSPDKVNYAYRLKGLEEKWIESGKRNFVSYSNLSPGTYIFQVKAQNPEKKWSIEPMELEIEIFPPFYMTWWFVLIEVLILSSIIVFIYRYLLKARTNKLLMEQNEKIKYANIQLTESENNLRELNATKDKFFRIISHDLKNPFTSLLSISEMIHENYDLVEDEEKKNGIQKIHESVKYIFELLENLLTWSRSQTGKIQYSPEKFELKKLIEQSIKLYSTEAEKKNIKIVLKCPENTLATADKNMCSSILRNLINNAIKFSYPNTEIGISVVRKDKFFEVQVVDQGIGIDEENLEKLFRIDLKFKSTGTAGEKGTGLGLLLCKEFAETNGGKIWAESTSGKGSTFFFLIPVSQN